jgi:hypothetical protein
MRNNRIEEACCSNQSCANYWFLESKIALRHAQNLFSTVSVKSGKARLEHLLSAYDPIPDAVRDLSLVPQTDVLQCAP